MRTTLFFAAALAALNFATQADAAPLTNEVALYSELAQVDA